MATGQSSAFGATAGEHRGSSSGGRPRAQPGGRAPTFGIRLLAGEHVVQQTLQVDQGVEIVGGGTSCTVLRLKGESSVEVRSTVRLANIAVCREVSSTAM